VLDLLRSPLQHFLSCVSVRVFLCLSSPVYSTSEGRLQHGDVVHDTLAEVHTNSVDRPHSCTASLADTLLSNSRAEIKEMPEIDMELQWTRNARSKFRTNIGALMQLPTPPCATRCKLALPQEVIANFTVDAISVCTLSWTGKLCWPCKQLLEGHASISCCHCALHYWSAI
jgi:hypothetical protein